VLGDSDSPAWSLKDSMAYKMFAAATCPVCAIRRGPRVAVEVTEKTTAKATGIPVVEPLG
jgi:hypothetical protein